MSHTPPKLKTFIANCTLEIPDVITRSSFFLDQDDSLQCLRFTLYVSRQNAETDSVKPNTHTWGNQRGPHLLSKAGSRKLLIRSTPVTNSSKLRTLSPIICENGLLHVGGRLRNSLLSEEVKHPFLLPKHNCISLLTLEHEHRCTQHNSQAYDLSQRHKITDQYMVDLPAVRVRQAYPFENWVRLCRTASTQSAQGTESTKGKDVSLKHLSILLPSDFRTHIFSDNGRNFVRAKKVLDVMYKLILSQQHNT